MDPNKTKHWNSLEVVKLGATILTPIVLFVLAYCVNESIRDAQLLDDRREAVEDFSRLINERTIRASQLRSALDNFVNPGRTDKLIPEVVASKKRYDESVFKWNKNFHANLLLVRDIHGFDVFTRLEQLIETRLVTSAFNPLGLCLTDAYNKVITSDSLTGLTELLADADEHLASARKCGFQVAEELYRLTESRPVGKTDKKKRFCAAIRKIEGTCPLTDRSPPVCKKETATYETRIRSNDGEQSRLCEELQGVE